MCSVVVVQFVAQFWVAEGVDALGLVFLVIPLLASSLMGGLNSLLLRRSRNSNLWSHRLSSLGHLLASIPAFYRMRFLRAVPTTTATPTTSPSLIACLILIPTSLLLSPWVVPGFPTLLAPTHPSLHLEVFLVFAWVNLSRCLTSQHRQIPEIRVGLRRHVDNHVSSALLVLLWLIESVVASCIRVSL